MQSQTEACVPWWQQGGSVHVALSALPWLGIMLRINPIAKGLHPASGVDRAAGAERGLREVPTAPMALLVCDLE